MERPGLGRAYAARERRLLRAHARHRPRHAGLLRAGPRARHRLRVLRLAAREGPEDLPALGRGAEPPRAVRERPMRVHHSGERLGLHEAHARVPRRPPRVPERGLVRGPEEDLLLRAVHGGHGVAAVRHPGPGVDLLLRRHLHRQLAPSSRGRVLARRLPQQRIGPPGRGPDVGDAGLRGPRRAAGGRRGPRPRAPRGGRRRDEVRAGLHDGGVEEVAGRERPRRRHAPGARLPPPRAAVATPAPRQDRGAPPGRRAAGRRAARGPAAGVVGRGLPRPHGAAHGHWRGLLHVGDAEHHGAPRHGCGQGLADVDADVHHDVRAGRGGDHVSVRRRRGRRRQFQGDPRLPLQGGAHLPLPRAAPGAPPRLRLGALPPGRRAGLSALYGATSMGCRRPECASGRGAEREARADAGSARRRARRRRRCGRRVHGRSSFSYT
mmetsp:Transcript_30541/g.87259  ORF Transcript_30541/g.87259 Transcript_30541/m.87259 type:complete len:437 (-) Transcript_30541:211-1521(-)